MERFKKTKDVKEILNLAKEYDFNLTEEDLGIVGDKKDFLEGKKKVDINELEKVSGAGGCYCVGAGGGDGAGTEYSFTCVCVAGGGGELDGLCKCWCVLFGYGDAYSTVGSKDC